MDLCGIHLTTILQESIKILIHQMSLKLHLWNYSHISQGPMTLHSLPERGLVRGNTEPSKGHSWAFRKWVCLMHAGTSGNTIPINSLAPERCGCNFRCVIFKHILVTDIVSISYEIAIMWILKCWTIAQQWFKDLNRCHQANDAIWHY